MLNDVLPAPKRRGSADVGLSRDFSFRNFAAPPARSPRGVDDGGLATYVARTSPSRAAGEASLACDAAPRGEPDGAEAPTRVRLGAESTRVLSNLVFFAWLRRQFADAAARLGCERVAAAMASVDHATFDDGSHDPAARQRGADGKVVASVTALLDAAAAARDDFEACLRAWAPGAALVKVRVKGARRSGEKAEHDYNARPPPACAWIHDALGAKLVFDTAEGLAAALDVVAGEADVLRVKNRFASPTPAGYRDVTLLCRRRLGAGVFVVEVQFCLPPAAAVDAGAASLRVLNQHGQTSRALPISC